MLIALRLVAAVACFLMAMMAAGDARTAREKGKPVAFGVFILFALMFSLSMGWVLLS